jgi:hypothetical protein
MIIVTTTPLAITLWEGGEHEMEARVAYTYLPGDPGRLSGPPEDCYPPEPAEVDIRSVFIRTMPEGVWTEATTLLAQMLADDEQFLEFLESEAAEQLQPDPDYLRDMAEEA